MFDAFEIKIRRPGKESAYLMLLSDCLLSDVQTGTFRVSIHRVVLDSETLPFPVMVISYEIYETSLGRVS